MVIAWYYWLCIIAAAVAILGGAVKGARTLWAFISAVVHFTDVAPALVEIGNQFKTNGGSSLRDAVDRIEAGQKTDHDIVVDHIQKDEAFQARVEPFLAGAK